MNRPPVAQRPQHQPPRAQNRAAQPPRNIAKQPDNRGPGSTPNKNAGRQPTPNVRHATPGNRAGHERSVAERGNDIRKARADLNTNTRTRLRGAFNFDHARIHHARFDRRIGHRIPRNIRLFAIPAAVIALFPYYQNYSYFVVDDELCIVDPQTYAVVDVVDRSYWSGSGGSQVAGLHLSEQDIALIREGIPPDFPDAGLRLRLALGADIPGGAPLHEFPTLLLERVPQLGPYRFLVSEGQIVIVQPADRSIARVIDR